MNKSLKTALLSAVMAAPATGVFSAPPMNVLLITTDDQGMQAGCYGDKLAITPNLDRLAAEGVLFTRAYVTHASCSPSRSSILTGLYPHQNGHIGLAGAHPEYALKPGISTLPFLLKKAGFYNGIIGKQHVNVGPNEIPFDFEWSRSNNPIVTRDVRTVADKAEEFLKKAGSRPFFLYLNYFDPHRPYDAEANQCKGLPEKPYTAADVIPFGFLGDAATLSDVAAYYNCVNRMDVGLGMLFDRLKQAGQYDNTLVIFISDNGPDFTRAKVTSYEAGVHVPLIVKWPEVSRAGLKCDDLVSAVDIVPTVLDAVGAECPPVAGRSLRETVQGNTPADWRKDLYSEYTSHAENHFYPRRSVRDGDLKLIHNMDSSRANPVNRRGTDNVSGLKDSALKNAFSTDLHPPEWELYNLGKDPFETVNLADHPEYATELTKLQNLLQDWQKETRDPLLDPAELLRLKKAHGL
ncbi:MAG: sulfatase [Kiritimatiellaceae bacterium]|nr:sulfatase [Kiritimatiellaceae bacterium]